MTALNAAIRDRRFTDGHLEDDTVTTGAGERVGVDDTIITRRNDRTLGVANRETWTVTGLGGDGSLIVAREAAGRGERSQERRGTHRGTRG